MTKHTLHESAVEMKPLKGRSCKLMAGSEKLPTRNLNCGISLFPPRAHAPGHIHEKEEEVIFVLEGTGETVIDGVAEKLSPGTFCVFPPGCLHSINNTGDTAIKLLFIFSPPARIGDYPDVDSTGTGE